MLISDRLDQISARVETVVGLTLGDDNARDAYNIVEDAVPDLLAAVRAVLDLHKPRHEHVLAAACSTESCDCEDGCRTVPTEVCGHCIDTGMSAHRYAYEEGGIETVLWPCPTVRAIATALGKDARNGQ